MNSLALTSASRSLNRLLPRMRENPVQREKIRELVDEALDYDRSFKITISQQRDCLIEECRLVEYASDPSTIDIDRMQNAVLSAKTSLGGNPTQFRNIYVKMHDQIEDCRKAISESEKDQYFKNLEIEKKSGEISICRKKADELERNANELDRCSRELDNRASYLEEKAREKEKTGVISYFVSAAVGIVLAPFTAGASLIIGAATAGVSLAVNFDSACDCRKNARSLESSASSKRAEASSLRSTMYDTEREIRSLDDDIRRLAKRIDALREIANTMESIEIFFRTSAKATGDVIDAVLNEVDDMQILVPNGTIKATERILTEALNSGRDFQRAQRALGRSQGDRRRKTKLLTLRQFNILKECLGKLKGAITGALSLQ